MRHVRLGTLELASANHTVSAGSAQKAKRWWQVGDRHELLPHPRNNRTLAMHRAYNTGGMMIVAKRQISRWLSCLAITATIVGCTTAQEIRRPNGAIEYSIVCGSAAPWTVCYKRANEECPTGYETLEERGGFNRKELRILCPQAS